MYKYGGGQPSIVLCEQRYNNKVHNHYDVHYNMFYTEHGFKIIIVVAQSHGMAIISKSVFISVNDFERRRRLLLRVRVIIVTCYYYTLFVANKNAITTSKTFYARTYSHRRRRISLYCLAHKTSVFYCFIFGRALELLKSKKLRILKNRIATTALYTRSMYCFSRASVVIIVNAVQ